MWRKVVPILLFLLALCATSAQANQRYTGYCARGGQSLILSGLTGAPLVTGSYPYCTVTVYFTGTTTIATGLTSDAAGLNPIQNPMTADQFGTFYFYAPNGSRLDVKLSGNGIPTWTIGDIYFNDSTGGGGGSGTVQPGAQYSLAQYPLSGTNNTVGPASITTDILGDLFAPFNVSICGPRPYVDVTCPAYAGGAKGDGTTDDTLAILAAEAAACSATGVAASKPDLYFPPGSYRAAQPQSGTAAVFTPQCAHRWLGAGYVAAGTQFPNSPAVQIITSNGATPVDVPLLALSSSISGFSTNGITFRGYMNSLRITSGDNFKFPNTTFSTQATGTDQNGDCPITVSNALYLDFTGTRFRTNTGTGHGYCFLDTNPGQTVGQITIDSGGIASFGCLLYYAPVVNMSVPTGGWIIKNAPDENCAADNIVIANPFGVTSPGLSGVHIQDTESYDPTNFTQAMLSTVFSVNGIIMDNVAAGNGGLGVALRAATSTLLIQDFHARCGSVSCVHLVVDQNGNTIGNGEMPNVDGGVDYVSSLNSPDTIVGSCRTDLFFGESLFNAPSLRMFQAGGQYADFIFDPFCGLSGATGADFGTTWSISTPAQGEMAISFPNAYPPTGLTSTVGGLGSALAPGTYTYNIRSTTSSSCGIFASAPTPITAPVAIPANTIINLNWTLPAQGASSVIGYCIQRNPGVFIPGWIFIPGGSTTTYADVGAAMGGSIGMPYVNTYAANNPTLLISPLGMTGPCLSTATWICAQQPLAGQTIDIPFNACVAAAIIANGTCDATRLPYLAVIGATLNHGDSSADAVAILMPPKCLWTSTITNGSDMVDWWGGATVVSEGPDGYPNCYIENASNTTSIGYVMHGRGVSNVNTFGTQRGMKYYNGLGASATTSGITVLIENFQDLTSFSGSAVVDNVDPTGADFRNNCCGFQINGSFFGGQNMAGVTPLVFENTSSQNQGIILDHVNVDAPGAGLPNIKCTDTFLQNSWYSGNAVYEETNTTDTGTTVNQWAGCGDTNFKDNRISTKAMSWAGKGWSFTSSGHPSFHVQGGISTNPGGSAVAVSNSNTNSCPSTPCLTQTSTSGYFDVQNVFICTSKLNPAVCGSAQQGSFVVAASATSVTVNTTYAPNDENDIIITPSSSATMGTRLGSVTCNTTPVLWSISAVVPQVSFTLTSTAPSGNPNCFGFEIRTH